MILTKCAACAAPLAHDAPRCVRCKTRYCRWACWKTYVGRPEGDELRRCAMTNLGNGLKLTGQYVEAVSVHEAELSTLRRFGAPVAKVLTVQGNLASAYQELGAWEQALRLRQEVYSGILKHLGKEDWRSLRHAHNYAATLSLLQRHQEAKALMRKTIPVARRVLGEDNIFALLMRYLYAQSLCEDTRATLGDFREAVNILEHVEPTARRVLGGTHPHVKMIEEQLRTARALRARETPESSG